MGVYINYDEAIKDIAKKRDVIDNMSFPYLGACDVLSTLPKVYIEPSTPIDVPSVIKERRLKKEWTQRQLADNAGISRQTAWNVERDNHGTTVYTFERLLNAMGYELAIVPMEKGANK